MEPTLPTPHGSPEMGPQPPRTPEQFSPAQGPEQLSQPERPAAEEQKQSHDDASAAPAMPVPQHLQKPALPQAPAQRSSAPVDDNPLVAADEDLIEKEWVDKAKKIISDTKHDPYEQERAVSRLQADYLRKRYGKEVKMPSGE